MTGPRTGSGPQFIVSSERLEERRVQTVTPDLYGGMADRVFVAASAPDGTV